MGSLTSTLVVSLKDDVSAKATKVGAALKTAGRQIDSISKAGISDRLGDQLSKLGLKSRDIDKVSAAWKQYATAQSLAGKSGDWTKAQVAQVRSWENATIVALRNVARERQRFTAQQAKIAAQAAPPVPVPRYSGGRQFASAAIGAGAAAVSGYKAKEFAKKSVVSAAEFDIAVRKQRELVDIPKGIQDSVLIPQAKKIGQDTQYSNLDVVKAQTTAMQGLPRSFDGQLRAEIGAAIVETVKNYAMTMDASLEGSSEAIRTFLQTTSKDISTKEKAVAQATRATNLMVKMAKLGGMSDEDAQQFMKFGAGTSNAAGLSDTTLAALGATGRKGGLRGDELGVFVRSMSSRLVAPTSKGLDALTAAGIDFNQYTKMPGGLSVNNLNDFSKRRFGKGFNASQTDRLDEILDNPEIVSNREEFTKQVSEIVAESFDKKKNGKTKAQDAQKIAKMVGDFHKLSTESVDAEGLLQAIMTNPKMTIALLNAFLSDKHGGKGSILKNKWDDYGSAKKDLDDVESDPGFAKRKADAIMEGLGGSFERLKGSVENLTLSIGQANEAWLKPAMNKAGDALDAVSNLPDKLQAWGSGVAAGGGMLGTSLIARTLLPEALSGLAAGGAIAGGIGSGALTGAALSDISKDFIKANPDFAQALQQNSMLGALSGDNALASAILHPQSTPGRFAKPEKTGGGWMLPHMQSPKKEAGAPRQPAWLPGSGPDVFTTGTKAIEGLQLADKAGTAGSDMGAALKSNFEEALRGVDPVLIAAMQRWTGLLGSFNASPTITPKFAPAPSVGKQTGLDPSSKFSNFSDGGSSNFGIG